MLGQEIKQLRNGQIPRKTLTTKIHWRRNHLNSITSTKAIESVLKNPTTKKTSCPDDFSGKLCQTFNEQLVPILHKVFQKVDIEEYFPET